MSDIHSTARRGTKGTGQAVRGADSADRKRIDSLLDALTDSGARTILEATVERPQSAREISEPCDPSLSTTSPMPSPTPTSRTQSPTAK
jgi:hypothetical protein